MKNLDEVTIIGKIINTHGIKGELKIYPYTDVLDRFKDLKYILLGKNLEYREISSARIDNRFAYIKIKDLDNINEVIKYKEYNIYVYDKDRAKLEDGRFYVSDLLGREVYNSNNEYIGVLVDVMDNPANDIFVVENKDDRYLIPVVDAFIKKIDKVIIADIIEGMKE